jgi:hypothetical protein
MAHGQTFRTLVYGITPGIQTLARYHYIGKFFQNSVLVFRRLTVTSDTIVFHLYDRYKQNESSSYTKQMGHGDGIYNLLFDSILIAI